MPSPTPIATTGSLNFSASATSTPPLALPSSLVTTSASTGDMALEGLDLGMGVLAGRGVEHQQAGMRRRRIELADDAHDLGELVHQVGLVVQAARGVDQQHVAALGPGAVSSAS